ncbi:MAG: type I-E CRISPR-associated protein Cas7/Cse4/CasC [Butyricicoccus sp.]|nr:type I-E CRISPR-associated protein Cas7/Cse4/CasC [Butyricicoccus sp.]
MAVNNRLYVDFHILQTVPPSCVNRDDIGSPKTAVYGGSVRARVSSQAWKRAMRLMFREIFDESALGKRTKRVLQMVCDAIQMQNTAVTEKDAEKLAAEALKKAGIKINSKDKKTDVLFFMSEQQAGALASLALAEEKEDKAYQVALLDAPSIDIALFGRMVASDPSLNYDAAAQIAHSISTHAVQTEFDYFTAVDDLSPEDTNGAGHLGTIEFNASTLYRYATINVQELERTLGEQAIDAVRGFAEALICSMPTGKQNTFANRTLPDAVYVTVRRDQPVNLSGAFEKAVTASADGFVTRSAARLCDYAEQMYQTFAAPPAAAFAVGTLFSPLAHTGSLPQMLDWLNGTLRRETTDGGQA